MPLHHPSAVSSIAAALLLATAHAARGDVSKIRWGPGSPPNWREEIITSTNRVVAETFGMKWHETA